MYICIVHTLCTFSATSDPPCRRRGGVRIIVHVSDVVVHIMSITLAVTFRHSITHRMNDMVD